MFTKIKKFIRIIFTFDTDLYYFLLKYLVSPSFEHLPIIKKYHSNSFIDIGSNKGQFSLAIKLINPKAKIILIEPIKNCFNIISKIFENKNLYYVYNVACGNKETISNLNVSNKNDSSSILDIQDQLNFFPKTYYKNQVLVNVIKLKNIQKKILLKRPTFLKIDVQGFELEVLKGSNLKVIDYILVECSFVHLYRDQPLFEEIKSYLNLNNFNLILETNKTLKKGINIQSDFLFKASSMKSYVS